MTTQNVIMQMIKSYPNNSNNIAFGANQSTNSFDTIMNQNMKSNITNSKKTTLERSIKTQTENPFRKNEFKENKMEKSDTVDEKDLKLETLKDSNSTQKTIVKQFHEDTTEVNTMDEDLTMEENPITAEILGILQLLRNQVSEFLQVKPEELDQLLGEQGKSILDILDTDTLKQMVLKINNESNVAAFLTDENLVNQMKQLMETVDNIVNTADFISSKGELETLLMKIKESDMSSALKSDQTSMDSENMINNLHSSEAKTDLIKTPETGKEVKIEVNKIMNQENSQGSNFLNENNPNNNSEFNNLDQYNIFLENLAGTTQTSKIDFTGNMVQVTEIREIANQIIERIKVVIKPEQTSMELQLNPENLGKVNLSVQSKNGVMAAQFIVQNEVTKEAIESQIHTLRETLNQQGIKVEVIEVTVSNYDFGQNSQTGTNEHGKDRESSSKKKITLEEINSLDMNTEEQNQVSDVTSTTGNQINYTA